MDGNRVVILDRGDYTTCTVNLQGAMITSWRIENIEQIFLSRRTNLFYLDRIRGGISLAFPRHGKWNFGRQHGFTRDVMWNLESGPLTMKENSDVYAEFRLTPDAYTESLWNYQFSLLTTVILRERKLEIHTIIENSSNYLPMDFTFLYHSYFKVPDVTKCLIKGLKGLYYHRLRDPDKKIHTEERNDVTISEFTELVYENIPKVIYLDIDGKWEKVLKISQSKTSDLLLWNPWADLIKGISGLDDDEYKYFVGVDLGVIRKKMNPRTCWKSSQAFELFEPNRRESIFANFYDYFDGIC